MYYANDTGYVYPPPWPVYSNINMDYVFSIPPPSPPRSLVHGYFLRDLAPPSLHLMNLTIDGSLHSEPLSDSFSEDHTFSLKVFVGRVPHTVTRNTEYGRAMESIFGSFGEVDVQWPQPATHLCRHSTIGARLTGYLFLMYKSPNAVMELRKACLRAPNGDLFLDLGPALDSIQVHVRLWNVQDAIYCIDESLRLDAYFNTVFLGRVPRMCTAYQIANIMQFMFGRVLCVKIDVDPVNNYPQGSAVVFFERQMSYLLALQIRNVDFRSIAGREWVTEIKPYVCFKGQRCDECQNRMAIRFCGDLRCLQYYCKCCWFKLHDRKNPYMKYHIPYEDLPKTPGRNASSFTKEGTIQNHPKLDFAEENTNNAAE